MVVQSLLLVPLDQRLGLRMIHYQTLLDGLLIVVGTTTLLSTQDKTFHQLVLRHVQFNHGSHLVATLIQHSLQSLSLWNGAWETVKDDTLVGTSEFVILLGQNANHQVVGYQLTVVNEPLCRLTQLSTILNLITQYVTG